MQIRLYDLSSKGTKFHPGCSHSQQITIEIKSFSIWHGGVGDSCRLQHLESPGSIPSRTLFLGRDGYISFYFETQIADSFTYYLFSFYLFLDEIHVLCKQNFFRRSNSASTFVDGLLGHPNRQRQTVYTDYL